MNSYADRPRGPKFASQVSIRSDTFSRSSSPASTKAPSPMSCRFWPSGIQSIGFPRHSQKPVTGLNDIENQVMAGDGARDTLPEVVNPYLSVISVLNAKKWPYHHRGLSKRRASYFTRLPGVPDEDEPRDEVDSLAPLTRSPTKQHGCDHIDRDDSEEPHVALAHFCPVVLPWTFASPTPWTGRTIRALHVHVIVTRSSSKTLASSPQYSCSAMKAARTAPRSIVGFTAGGASVPRSRCSTPPDP